MVVDEAERPDLMERARAGTIHEFTCPECGMISDPNRALLIYRSGKSPPVLYATAPGLSEEQDHLNALILLGFLKAGLGAGGHPDLEVLPPRLPCDLLPAVLEGTLTLSPEQAEAAVRFRLALEHFIRAPNLQYAWDVVSYHPELLDAKAIALLDRRIGLLRRRKDDQAVGLLEVRRSLLERCGRVGIDAAFAEAIRARGIDPQVLADIGSEMAEAAQRGDWSQRVRLCRMALALADRDGDLPSWAGLHASLANSLRMSHSGDRTENLKEAIDHYVTALGVFTREISPVSWAAIQIQLAQVYVQLYKDDDRDENLEKAIHHAVRALEVYDRQRSPAEWVATHCTLANAYALRCIADPPGNAEKAIEHGLEVLGAITKESDPQDYALAQLYTAFGYIRSTRIDDRERTEGIMRHGTEALQASGQDAPELTGMLADFLARAYRWRGTGDPAENLEHAIRYGERAREAFELATARRPMAEVLVYLADAYLLRPGGVRSKNIERAIALAGRAAELAACDGQREVWAKAQNTLGNAFRQCQQGDPAENAERAVGYFRRALEVYTRDAYPDEWARLTSNLAQALLFRIGGERPENIEQAIELCGQALEVLENHSDTEVLSSAHRTIATAYRVRMQDEHAENLERAVVHFEQALAACHRAEFPIVWASTHNNLANALLDRVRGDYYENRARALDHLRKSLEVYTRQSHPEEWATIHLNMAQIYHELVNDSENRTSAIRCCEQALGVLTREAYPIRWADAEFTLATVLLGPNITGTYVVEDIRSALDHFRKAQEVYTEASAPERWSFLQHNLGVCYSHLVRAGHPEFALDAARHFHEALRVRALERFPEKHRLTQLNLGVLLSDTGDWAGAHEALSAAIAAGELLLSSAYTETGRREQTGSASQDFAEDAYCLLRLGRMPEALARMEQGRARFLAEALALSPEGLGTLPEALRPAIREAHQAIRVLEAEDRLPAGHPGRRDGRELALALRRARNELQGRIAEIRRDDPDLLPQGLDVAGLFALAPSGGALVFFLVSRLGGAAIVLPHGATAVSPDHVIDLGGLTVEFVYSLLYGPDRARILRGGPTSEGGWILTYLRAGAGSAKWRAVIESAAETLWGALMAPVQERLLALGLVPGAPVVLLPQGLLSALPLHAAQRPAGARARSFLDDFTVSYAPSGYTLRASLRGLERRRPPRSLLAVINPTADLPFTVHEGEAVAALFAETDRNVLIGPEATRDAVVAATGDRGYIHFSCHGTHDWRDVFRSQLLLADAPLTLADILARLDLQTARLVTLSACETGLSEIGTAADEFFGLPAGFLRAGAPAVVSSLWAVNDLSTSLLVGRFYRRHLEDGLSPAAALRDAQLWLRDLTLGELNLILADWQVAFQTRHLLVMHPGPDSTESGFLISDNDRPYASPFFWAAFTLSGA